MGSRVALDKPPAEKAGARAAPRLRARRLLHPDHRHGLDALHAAAHGLDLEKEAFRYFRTQLFQHAGGDLVQTLTPAFSSRLRSTSLSPRRANEPAAAAVRGGTRRAHLVREEGRDVSG
jgi:hypothetical protein